MRHKDSGDRHQLTGSKHTKYFFLTRPGVTENINLPADHQRTGFYCLPFTTDQLPRRKLTMCAVCQYPRQIIILCRLK